MLAAAADMLMRYAIIDVAARFSMDKIALLRAVASMPLRLIATAELSLISFAFAMPPAFHFTPPLRYRLRITPRRLFHAAML